MPFQMLANLGLGTAEWTKIAKDGAWQFTRMNLNTFARHGVFGDRKVTKLIADRLRDAEKVREAKCFPYQLLMAYAMASQNADIPRQVTEALQDAMEIATENVPAFDGYEVFVFPDVSASMGSPVKGRRYGSTTSVTCHDVSGLAAATVLRTNKLARVIPFEGRCVNVALNPRDSVMTNANKLARVGGGSTACSAPLAKLNAEGVCCDEGRALCIYVSDNESWIDSGWSDSTLTMDEWQKFKRRNKKAKMVCIDIQAYDSTQAKDREDILNIGGFSDTVWKVVDAFVKADSPSHWVDVIKQVDV